MPDKKPTEKKVTKKMSPLKVAILLTTCLAVGLVAPQFYGKFEQQLKLTIIAGLICH